MDEVLAARQRVKDAVAAAGITNDYRLLPEDVPTAPAAAAAIGCEVGAIANSLVFTADGEPVMVMASGAHRVDTAHVAQFFGATKLRRADADVAFAATGQRVGGCAPVGHPGPLRTLVDESLRAFDVVWVSGGDKQTVMSLTFDELVRLTNGKVVSVNP